VTEPDAPLEQRIATALDAIDLDAFNEAVAIDQADAADSQPRGRRRAGHRVPGPRAPRTAESQTTEEPDQ
jgi:hypothetical protein